VKLASYIEELARKACRHCGGDGYVLTRDGRFTKEACQQCEDIAHAIMVAVEGHGVLLERVGDFLEYLGDGHGCDVCASDGEEHAHGTHCWELQRAYDAAQAFACGASGQNHGGQEGGVQRHRPATTAGPSAERCASSPGRDASVGTGLVGRHAGAMPASFTGSDNE